MATSSSTAFCDRAMSTVMPTIWVFVVRRLALSWASVDFVPEILVARMAWLAVRFLIASFCLSMSFWSRVWRS